MEKEKLYQVLVSEHQEDTDLTEWNELITRYPWWDLPRINQLLAVQRNNEIQAGEELKSHALFIHDRRNLYMLLNSERRKELAGKYEKIEPRKTGFLSEDPENQVLLDFSYIDFAFSEAEYKNDSQPEDIPLPPNKNDLIERFLIEEPGPIKIDRESNLKGDVSSHSVLENEHLLTDTLAKIYVKQGLYSKAIFAYEKLSLKYPEKSVYFASQIKEINELINKK